MKMAFWIEEKVACGDIKRLQEELKQYKHALEVLFVESSGMNHKDGDICVMSDIRYKELYEETLRKIRILRTSSPS
ncbi:MAG: hypothetical protein LBN29_01190 [Mediterranea sp.]|jgi:hypothetical protein|nr:hypothetical protein [Mediterranea sp.]